MASVYELFYWPTLQGRGELIRLALEEAGVDYIDVARLPVERGGGIPALMRILRSETDVHPPFAPPILKVDGMLVAQTANILMFLGARHGLVPEDESSRLWANQLQLTLSDVVAEVHDTHHPIATSLYYEDQKAEALRRTTLFLDARLPKLLGYFERILSKNTGSAGRHLVGDELSYVDLSAFQLIAGLRYAFPRAMKRIEPDIDGLVSLHDVVAARPRIAAYLASERRLPFNQDGLFRHSAELDLP